MAIGVTAGPLTLAGALLSGGLWLCGWTLFDAIAVASLLCLVSLVFALGVVTLQCWNANGQVVASGGLLAACLGAIFLLSAPEFLSLMSAENGLVGAQIAALLAEALSFVGLVICVVMTPIVIVEVLLRWTSGAAVPVSAGTFLVIRWVGSLLVVSVGSALIREEGITRLLSVLAAMRM